MWRTRVAPPADTLAEGVSSTEGLAEAPAVSDGAPSSAPQPASAASATAVMINTVYLGFITSTVEARPGLTGPERGTLQRATSAGQMGVM